MSRNKESIANSHVSTVERKSVQKHCSASSILAAKSHLVQTHCSASLCMAIILFTSYLILHTSSLQAQLLTPLSTEMNRRVEYEMIKSGSSSFTVLKPYVDTQLRGNARQDSLSVKTPYQGVPAELHKRRPGRASLLTRKLFHESLIQVDSGAYYLFADPVFEFGVGKEIGGRNTYINTRGFRAGGRLGKHVAFGADFYETQGIFNSALTQKFIKTWIAPGEGLARRYDSIGYDFAHSSGYISVMLLKKLNILLAQGRQFIGDGYRSLLISDASFTYPYLKFTWQNDYLLYSWSNMLLQEYGFPVAVKVPPFRRKSATIHTIGFNLKNRIQFTIVKMQLYNNPDSVGKYTLSFKQLNPLILPEQSSSKNHSIWGFNLKFNPIPNIAVYNQWAIDNPFSNSSRHYAVQVGTKVYGRLRNHTPYLNVEYNRVPAMTYASNNPILGWKHYTEPLAHPYGHNFEEGVFIGGWCYKRWQLSGQANVARQLENIQDLSPYSRAGLTYYPNGKKLSWYKAEVAFYINPKTLMNISLGYNYRKEILTGAEKSMSYFYFVFRTQLFNKYLDF